MSVQNYTLAFNVSGVNDNVEFPVGYTLCVSFMTAMFVIYNYIFLHTSTLRATTNRFPKFSDKKWFVFWDILLYGAFGGWGVFYFLLWILSFTWYYDSLKLVKDSVDPNVIRTISFQSLPQEYLTIVMVSLSIAQLCVWRLVMLRDVYKAWNADSNELKDGRIGRKELNDDANYALEKNTVRGVFFNVLMASTPATMLFTITLFLGTYSYIIVNDTTDYSYCGGAACWAYSKGFIAVGPLLLASSICLCLTLVYAQFREKLLYLEVENALFANAQGFHLNKPIFLGWVPVYPLSQMWIICYGCLVVTSVIVITHDILKGVMWGCLWILVPIFLTLLAQNPKFFYPYHIASVFCSIVIVYTSSAILNPPAGTTVSTGAVPIMFGALLTGPDLAANVDADAFTVNLFAGITFALTMFMVLADMSSMKNTKDSIFGICSRETQVAEKTAADINKAVTGGAQ
jgi:hypothetical protein